MDQVRFPFAFLLFVVAVIACRLPLANAVAQDGRILLQRVAPGQEAVAPQQFSIAQADFTMLPSVTTSPLAPFGAGEQTLDLFASCVLEPFGLVVPNCDITLEWQARAGSGGHVHNTNRPPGRIRTENRNTGGSITPGPAGEVSDNSGSDGFLMVTYTAPEASGMTDLTVRGVAVVFGIPVQFGPDRSLLVLSLAS